MLHAVLVLHISIKQHTYKITDTKSKHTNMTSLPYKTIFMRMTGAMTVSACSMNTHHKPSTA